MVTFLFFMWGFLTVELKSPIRMALHMAIWPNVTIVTQTRMHLIAATGSGAIIPLLQGYIADAIGIHHAFILPALCYVYIAYFVFRGSRYDNLPA